MVSLCTPLCLTFRELWRGSRLRSWLNAGKQRCCLCRALVQKEAWESGEHRRTCMAVIEHAEELGLMPHYYREWGPKKCPKCEVEMKVWPADGEKFECDNNRMCETEGGSAVNRGEPPWMKFGCFPCDINFCSTCVLVEQDSHMEPRRPDIGLPHFDIPRTQKSESIPWIPTAPPDDTKSANQNIDPPSYQEAIAP